MKPRQTLKNFHHHNNATATMFPCHNQNAPAASNNTTLPPALRDLNLAKLGLSLEDLPNLQAQATSTAALGSGPPTHHLQNSVPPPPPQPQPTTTSQEEIVKCLRAIYGNKNTNEIMQKLPLKLNEWPNQSMSPPDYSRALNNSGVGGTSGGVTSSSNTTAAAVAASLASEAAGFGGGGGGGSGVAGYSPFNNLPPTLPSLNNNASKCLQQNKQDPKLASASNSAQLQHLHQAPLSINQHFKMSTTNTQQPQQQQQQHHTPSQQKSVFDSTSSSTSSSSASSIVRHQHLQKLLKASGQAQMKSSSSSSQPSTSSRNDTYSMVANHHPAALSANIQPASQPATFSSVPKSLLNLAACTSSSAPSNSTNATSLPASSKFSTMVNQLNMISSRIGEGPFDKQFARSSAGGSGSSLNNSSTSDNMPISNSKKVANFAELGLMNSSAPQSLIKPNSSTNSSSQLGNSSRSSLKQLQSLLPEEQLLSPPMIRANTRTQCNPSSYGTSKQSLSSSLSQQIQQKVNSLNQPSTSKEAFLAELQERAARAGVSIGEINKPVQSSSSFSTSSATPATSLNTTSTSVIISPSQSLLDEHTNLVGRREIESALSRVEARNDLSLLYPPMLLADNSQKQINALSAGFQDTEDMELFTKEVKKIVLEECNIIYECKECSNLFRSLANLVKHKRTYCLEQSVERNNVDNNKRAGVSLLSPMDQLAPGMNNDPSTNSYYQMPKQPNLSKLLRSQPKQRLPKSKDSVLMGALTMSNISATDNDPLAAFESEKRSSDVHEQLARCSSLAKTLLDEKAKAYRPKQSLIELSKAESMHRRFGLAGNNWPSGGTATKRAAPKRKFLEDCIQKVKRDRISNEEEEESILRSSQTSSPSPMANSSFDKESRPNHHDTATSNQTENSDEESDILMIDLEEPKRKEDPKKDRRRPSNAAYSSASSTSSMKMNSSSALLKALTRPIAKKPTHNETAAEPDKATTEEMVKEDPEPAESVTPASIKHEVDEEEAGNGGSACDGDEPVEETEGVADLQKDNCEQEVNGEDEEEEEEEEEEDEEPNGEEVANPSPPSPLFVKQTCDLCDVDYEDLSALTAHITEAHQNEKMVYPCIFCSFSSITLENVCRHILDIHKKPKAQVHRLKEVVRSRSYTSSDFQPCSDYSSDSEVSGGSEQHDDYESNSSHGSNKKPCSSNSSKDIDLQESKTTPTKAGLAAADPNTSGSSSTAAGGIMKLKIQLKTRPDEKSKVYEIV